MLSLESLSPDRGIGALAKGFLAPAALFFRPVLPLLAFLFFYFSFEGPLVSKSFSDEADEDLLSTLPARFFFRFSLSLFLSSFFPVLAFDFSDFGDVGFFFSGFTVCVALAVGRVK